MSQHSYRGRGNPRDSPAVRMSKFMSRVLRHKAFEVHSLPLYSPSAHISLCSTASPWTQRATCASATSLRFPT
eukprot:m.107208 g.107208  ORF g.107208 m.107208 type:complete len:73 (+) comp9209_c0_seq4:101-319(+)